MDYLDTEMEPRELHCLGDQIPLRSGEVWTKLVTVLSMLGFLDVPHSMNVT